MGRPKLHRNIGSASVFLAVFGLLFLATSPKNLIFTRKSVVTRKTSTKHKEVFQKITDHCEVPELHVPQERIVASFLASFPGSGSRLQLELVEAITGIVTTDDTFSNGQQNVVAVKTHFPCPSGREFPGAEEILKAMVFIRHPMETLAAYYDIIYAAENNLTVDPPRRAPLDQWIKWRDLSFARELETWRKHFTYWMDRYGTQNRLVLPYEKLTSRKYGPGLVVEMAEFLQRGNNGITTADSANLPCIWQKILKKVQSDDNDKKQKLRRRLQELQEMSMQPHQQQQFTQIRPTERQEARIPAPQEQQQQQFLIQQTGEGFVEGMRQQPSGTSLQTGLSRRLPSKKNGLALPDETSTNQIPESSRMNDEGQQLEQTGGLEDNEFPTPMETPRFQEEDGDQNDTTAGQVDQGQSILENEPPSAIEQASGANENQVGLLNDEANVPLEQDALESKEADAQVDDNCRPYAEYQRKEVVAVLTQLLERYRDDRDLAPVLVEYIDQVTKEFGGHPALKTQR
ncbi:hypothetical protein MHU86_15786 [Fragilaria crotonensis]|nr:hypothetical protein MHU86_15786 [Fragilaria crotonensis]